MFIYFLVKDMNEEYDKIILKLNENIHKIILLYEQEQEKTKKLSEQVNIINNELTISINKYQELEQRYNNLKLAKIVVGDESDEKEAIVKLNKIIREIDNCIALLNK